MSLLNSLKPIVRKPKKRIGRGFGSGVGGHTVGRGTKGQKARKSGNVPLWFEGGALALIKRMPMQRGKSRFNVVVPTAQVSLTQLQKMTAAIVTLETLKLERVIHSRYSKAKVIATGTLTRSLSLKGVRVSAQARLSIEKAGGSIDTD